MAELAVENIEVSYESVRAVRGVSLRVADKGCAAILGPNGAGKSSLMKAISGLVSHTGKVMLDGEELSRDPVKAARYGVGHVLEGRHVFTQMTVKENLLVGRFGATARGNGQERLAAILDMFPVLKAKLNRLGGELSGGEQQTVAIGRSLMADPKVLLMDEPSLGLSPVVIEQLAVAVARIREDLGTTLLVAEQSITLALDIASHFFILRRGEVVYSGGGTLDTLWTEVHKAYLGNADDAVAV
jgi:branched-chain amino acid transport system ATP-binding protein